MKDTIWKDIAYKEGKIKHIKSRGVELLYGVNWERPVSYINKREVNFSPKEDFEAFLKTVSRKEWKSVEI
jgi:hypothetical protein